MRHGVKTKYIYMLKDSDEECVKIGITNNLERRLKQLSVDYTIDKSNSYFMTGTPSHVDKAETLFHNAFKSGKCRYWRESDDNGSSEWYSSGNTEFYKNFFANIGFIFSRWYNLERHDTNIDNSPKTNRTCFNDFSIKTFTAFIMKNVDNWDFVGRNVYGDYTINTTKRVYGDIWKYRTYGGFEVLARITPISIEEGCATFELRCNLDMIIDTNCLENINKIKAKLEEKENE